jgi:hypothetical protein
LKATPSKNQHPNIYQTNPGGAEKKRASERAQAENHSFKGRWRAVLKIVYIVAVPNLSKRAQCKGNMGKKEKKERKAPADTHATNKRKETELMLRK